MILHIEAAAATHVGRRSNNEDCFGVEPDLGLYVVADGMGGYEGGEVASRLAVDCCADFVRRQQRDPGGTWPCREERQRSFEENLLSAALERAHQDILQERHGALREMGSTAVALLVKGRHAALAHVGDSRAYRLRAGQLVQLTADHSMQAELAAAGLSFPYRNYITRALGVKEHTADVATLELAPGDVLLLCSDGLSETLPGEALARLLALPRADDAARSLVDAAVQAGASDNVTVIVVRVTAQSSPPESGSERP